MAYDPTLERNAAPFMSAFGSDFTREADSTTFRAVITRYETESQRTGAVTQLTLWSVRAHESVALARGEIISAGTRRYRVQYSRQDDLGLTEYVVGRAD